LRQRGFSLQRVRKVIRFLQKEFGKRLVETVTAGSEYHLLTDGIHLYLETSAQQIVDILKNARQPMLTVCLSDTVRQVQADLRTLSSPNPTPPGAETKSREKRAGSPGRRRPVARAGNTPSALDRRKVAQ
jgi:hypothetical protein